MDNNVVVPLGSVLTELVFCVHCLSTDCTEEKAVFHGVFRCEGNLVHRAGIHKDTMAVALR